MGPTSVLLPLLAAAVGAAPQPGPEFRSGTAVVLLDVIARDRAGRPVRDLRPDEFRVLEDGRRCEVRSLRYVETGAALEPAGATGVSGPASALEAPPAGPPARSEPGAPSPVNLVTLVFDRLAVEDTIGVTKAARQFVERHVDARTHVAVLRIGSSLGLVHGFSGDKGALLRAVDEATASRETRDRSLNADARRAFQQYVTVYAGRQLPISTPEIADAARPSTERVNPGGPPPGGRDFDSGCMAECKQREAVARALRMADELQRTQEGRWSLYPLLALVKAQAELAGRKTLIFFSAGLAVPPSLDDVFETVISEANRSNVSVYAVDARGLQAISDMNASGETVRQAALTSMLQQLKADGSPTSVAEMQVMDKAEDALRLNQQQTLSDLSESTGGFLLANSNDLGSALDRVADDIRGYYELTYVPAVASFDGRFRRIAVEVSRRDVALQSRRGYFALPPSQGLVLPWEMPLLSALSATPAPRDFPQRAAAFHFAPSADGVETAVVVEVPLATLPFARDQKAGTYELRLATLALLKDASGRVVERFSEDYPLAGPLGQLEGVKQSNAVLRRVALLAPGSYTLETATGLRGAPQAAVSLLRFDVPWPAQGPHVSSLVLLRRADPLPEGAPPSADPFRVEAARLVPALQARVSKAVTENLAFFARVYPAPEQPPPVLTLEFVRDGTVVARATPEAPPAAADGTLACISGVPAASLAPGAYDVRLTVAQGDATATSTSHLELIP